MATTVGTVDAFITTTIDPNSSLIKEPDVTAAAPDVFVPRASLNYAELQNYWAYRTALEVIDNKYYVLAPFSFVCNLFCFAVLFKRLRTAPAYMFMVSIAVWDFSTIFWKTISVERTERGWEVGDAGCSALTFLMLLCPLLSEWLVILLTIDRCIAVWFPFKHRQICTMRLALVAYGVVVLGMISLNCYVFWAVKGVIFRPYYYCMPVPKYTQMIERFFWAYQAFQSYIPIVLMILLNVLLVYKVRKRLSVMGNAKNARGNGNKMSTENRVTIMALAIAIGFVFLVGPFAGFTAALHIWDYDKDIDTYVTYAVVQTVVYILYDLNHCLNVFLYFLSCAQFRKDALRLITCGRKRGRKYTQTTNGNKMTVLSNTAVSTISNDNKL